MMIKPSYTAFTFPTMMNPFRLSKKGIYFYYRTVVTHVFFNKCLIVIIAVNVPILGLFK